MNRTLLSTAAAAAGLAGVLVFGPHTSPVAASGEVVGTVQPSNRTASPAHAGASTVPRPSGSYTGAVVRDQFGPVQVKVSVSNGTLTDVQVIQQPGDGRSRWINGQAVPVLVSQALKAQSASIHGVSGATLTSQAFAQSLSSALQEAGL